MCLHIISIYKSVCWFHHSVHFTSPHCFAANLHFPLTFYSINPINYWILETFQSWPWFFFLVRILKLALYFICLSFEGTIMHVTQEHDRCTLLPTKQIASCCLYILELSLSVNISGCCLSSFEDEQPPEMMEGQQCLLGSPAWVSQISCQAWWLQQRPSLAPEHAALSMCRRVELSCITEPFPDGCATALMDVQQLWQIPGQSYYPNTGRINGFSSKWQE